MDKLLYNFFKELKFDDGEIETLVEQSPVLEELSVDEASENLNILISFGYPVDDLTYIIAMNPGFLCRNSEELKNDLKKLASEYDDIEQVLKNDPFLI